MSELLKGKFECEVTGTSLEPQGDRKGPTIVISFQVLSKVHPDGTKEQVEGEIFRRKWYTLTEKNASFVALDLAYLGFEGQPSQLDPNSDNFFDLAGSRHHWYVTNREWPQNSGEYREEWGLDRPKSAKSPEPFDPTSRMEVDAKFGSFFGKAGTPTPSSATNAADTNDAPF